MESCDFSFTKRPIDRASFSKRHSAISNILPNNGSEEQDPKNKGSKSSITSRTFSDHDHKNLVDAEMKGDDPSLDYNEQIRAPKVRNHRSISDITSELLNKGHETKFNDFTTSLKPEHISEERRQYLPATVDISRSTSFEAEMTPSTSLGDETYNLDNYLKTSLSNNQLIANLDPFAGLQQVNRSPLSSKKNSNDSITSSKKQPRFTMVPIRPIEEPKTPNYIPCVLRPSVNLNFAGSSTNLGKDSFLSPDDSADLQDLDDSSISRDHWKPNNSTSKCSDCSSSFSILNRRHHCRKCGDIFCGNCLFAKAKLNPIKCDFEMNGVLTKVCFDCGKHWSEFLVENFKKFRDADEINFPNFRKTSDNLSRDRVKEVERATEQAKTVPADWTWSSF